ncbi:MAG: hypothetical protein IIA11_08305 [Proteobacteria bacterium]|nr:hypothetical protein [Pseudomonadota bacterium]
MKYSTIITAVVTALVLSACGGTKVLKDSQPLQATKSLAAASDQRVTAILDWVIVRDGPGTWAKNADWDEYLLRVSNSSDQPIQITGLIVIDSLDTRIEPAPGRKHLVKGSKLTARRYKDSGIKVKAGRGTGTMLVAGAAVTAVGVGAAYSAVLMGGFGTAGAGAGAAGGLLLLGPALVVGGVVRGVRNSAVNKEIVQRQTPLPLQISAGEQLALDIFFPLAPSPRLVEIIYTDANGEHRLGIDTSAALHGLHMDASKK